MSLENILVVVILAAIVLLAVSDEKEIRKRMKDRKHLHDDNGAYLPRFLRSKK